jgi:major membrane immunogen (membrane-anchored lipoprotein)
MQKILKLKPKRLLSVFLAALMAFTAFMPVLSAYAAVEKCTLNIRVSEKYKYMNNWAYPDRRSGIHLATVADGSHKGEVVYCIEFGKDMGETGQEEAIYDIEDVPAWQDMSSTQQRGITYATIYGYPNFNYGVSNEATQVATQFVVWEYSQGYRTSADGNNPTAGLNGTSSKIENAIEAAGFDVRQQYYQSGVVPYDDVMTAYKGILNGIKTHRTLPSFRNDTLELTWNNSNNRYEAKVTDSNGVLSNFALTSGNSNLKFSKSGNTLTVYSTAVINSAATVTMTKTCTTVGADIGFVPENTTDNQSLVGRLTDPVTASFKVKTATGNARIIKTSEDDNVGNIKFTLEGNGLTYTGVTDSKGVFLKSNIPAGTYTVTEESIDKYVPQKSQTVTVRGGETVTVNFDNILKKFRVKVVKTDIEEGTAQGDASLSGAKYGLFKGDELIDTYVTDSNASFTTDYCVCDTDWTIKELESSEGYLLDSTVHKVGADPKLYTVEFNTTENNVTEEVIKGNIAIIKHTDDGSTQIETPEANAEFQAYLKSAGSYENADPDERDILVTDEQGYAKSKDLPYGVYVVHQIKGKEGSAFMTDFEVYISENGVTKTYLINNAPFVSYLKAIKVDSETGKNIPYANAAFQIYDPNGNLVRMTYTYNTPTTIDTFYTNSEGYLVTPEKLPYGKGYTLVEVEAPYGYVLDPTPIKFDITPENSTVENALTIVKVERPNTPQKAIIEIGKTGEVFASVGMLGGGYVDENGNEIEFPITYSPIYETKGLANTVIQIFAAEDIVTGDGTVRAYQGELVDEITTDETGYAKSKELYLGKYTVVEKTASNGFYNANEQYDVELTYAGQTVSVTSTELNLFNERQKVTVSLAKVLEQDETFGIGMNNELKNVQFGIFADEDITAADGTVIPADSLISYANCDENGNITFNCDLPIGFKWYVKEIATDEHYVLSDEKYAFNTAYQGQEVQTIEITVNDGEPIENELIYGTVKGLKTDRETGKTIEGASFGLFTSDETEFTEDAAILTAESDKDGIFTFENVPYGEWIIKELHPAENYLPSDEIYTVTVSADEQVIEINVVNDQIPELKTTATIDGEKEAEIKDEITIEDVVEYKHLVPGKEYNIKGILMDESTNEPFKVDGKEITSEVTFTPEEPNGEVMVSFTFDASGITEETELVVFETLYLDGIEIATHADIEDKDQTVTLTIPVETPNTGDASNRRTLATVMGVSALGISALTYYLLKKKKSNKEDKA